MFSPTKYVIKYPKHTAVLCGLLVLALIYSVVVYRGIHKLGPYKFTVEKSNELDALAKQINGSHKRARATEPR